MNNGRNHGLLNLVQRDIGVARNGGSGQLSSCIVNFFVVVSLGLFDYHPPSPVNLVCGSAVIVPYSLPHVRLQDLDF